MVHVAEQYMPGRIKKNDRGQYIVDDLTLNPIQMRSVVSSVRLALDKDPKLTLFGSSSEMQTIITKMATVKKREALQFHPTYTMHGVINALVPGLGKTIVGFCIAYVFVHLSKMNFDGNNPWLHAKIMIAGSKSVQSVQKQEMETSAYHVTNPYVPNGTAEDVLITVEKWAGSTNVSEEFLIVSTDQLLMPGIIAAIMKAPVKIMIFDEFQDQRKSDSEITTLSSGNSSDRLLKIFTLLHHEFPYGDNGPQSSPAFIVAMTGTPYMNSLTNLMSLLYMLCPQCLGVSIECIPEIVKKLEKRTDDELSVSK